MPTARLDVTTWTYHSEPPSTVDADLDRKTDRLFTTARMLQWTTGVCFAGVALPSSFGFVALSLIALVVGVVALVISVVLGLWHQQLRKRTGVPVVPVLADTLESCATSMRTEQDAFEFGVQQRPADYPPEEQQKIRELREAACGALHAHHKITRRLARQFSAHCELVAQADRRGWTWLRDRHARTIARLVLQVLNPHGAQDDNEAPADPDAPNTA